jgi:hypothetical protein
MTTALIRVCNKCGVPFLKDEGCNKMKCVCGNIQCFVCSQNIQDYSHFGEDKCPLFDDTTERLRTEVATAQERAIRDFTGTDMLEGQERQMSPPPSNDQQNGPQQREVEYFDGEDEENELEGILAEIREYELWDNEKRERAEVEARRINRRNLDRPVDGSDEPRFPITTSAGPPVQPIHGERTTDSAAPALHRRYPNPPNAPNNSGRTLDENSAEANWLAFLARSQTIHRNSQEEMQIMAESSPVLEGYWIKRNRELDEFIDEARQFVEATRRGSKRPGVVQERHERARVLLGQAQMEANHRRRETAARQKARGEKGKQRERMRGMKGVGKFVPKSWGLKFRRN